MASLMNRFTHWALSSWVVYAAIVILALQAGSELAIRFWPTPESHHTILSNRMTQPFFIVGDYPVTSIVVDRNRPKDCVLTIHRNVANAETGVLVFNQISPGIAENGVRAYQRAIEVHLPIGKYLYFFSAVDVCSGRSYPPVNSTQAQFEVVP